MTSTLELSCDTFCGETAPARVRPSAGLCLSDILVECVQ